jgi:Family of unknown function (DUF6065)
MVKVNLRRTYANPPEIRQSRINRDWMDGTYKKHAYQCLPMTVANVYGWELILPHDVVAQWDGGNTVPKILEGESYGGRQLAYGGIVGMVSFSTGWIFGTEPGYETFISGSPNYLRDDAQALSAIIPSSWWPDEFQMNWKINKVGEPVTFEAGMPFMFFSIFESTVLENVEFTVDNLWDNQELMNSRAKYGDLKMKNNEENPWTWTKGIRTGLDADGNKIGPTFTGMPKLSVPGQ